MTAIEETICRAISNRLRLAFRCGDGMCVAEPHQLGRDGEGHLVLRAYLVEGEAEAGGEPEGWRVYRVADFYWALASSDPFDGPRPGHVPAPNEAIRVAVCEL